MDGLQNLSAEDLKDGFDDWYERALQSGAGFKTDEEKAAYIASLGDPMKHPMFATTTEDLVGNPMADAFRAIREEDKTLMEIAMMYKEDANQLIKKSKTGTSSSSDPLHEAVNTYLHAISFVDQAITARAEGTEDEKDKEVDLNVFKSQLYSNIAQVWLTLKNYRSCIIDADRAINCWEANTKAHYRKCKALLQLKRYQECIEACNVSVKFNSPSDQTFIDEILKTANADLQKKIAFDHKSKQEKLLLQKEWGKIWIHAVKRNKELEQRFPISDASMLNSSKQLGNNIKFGFCSDVLPSQLHDLYPSIDAESKQLCVPILFLYPQHSQLDVIQCAKIDVLLVEYLAEMFPEFEDGIAPVSWDSKREYQLSSLSVYCPLNQSMPVNNMNEFIQSCNERRQLQGLEGEEACEETQELLRSRVALLSSSSVPSASASASSSAIATAPAASPGLGPKGFAEVHVGCSLEQILRLGGCRLAGGILTLLVYVKGNQSHKDFIANAKDRGFQLLKLQPNESISTLTK